MDFSKLADCGPCLRDNKKKLSSVWCIECAEPLCLACEKVHNLLKMTSEHHLVENQKSSSDSISYDDISDLQNCHIHQHAIIDRFCNNHSALCCQCCMSETHFDCKSVESIDTVAKNIKTSLKLENTTLHVNSLIQLLTEIRNDKRSNIGNFQHSEMEVKKKIEAVKISMIIRIKEMAESLTSELQNVKKTKILELEKQAKETEQQINKLELKKKMIDLFNQKGSETHTFLLLQRLKSELATEENLIRKNIEECSNTYLSFNDGDDIMSLPKALGKIDIISEPAVVKYKPSPKIKRRQDKTDSASPVSHIKSFKLCSEFDIDFEKGFVSGICINEDDVILLCLRGTDKLLMYDLEGKPNGELVVSGNPFDVSCVPETDKAVVALPDSSTLQMVDIDMKDPENIIQMPESCWSVTTVENKLIIAGGFKSLYVIDIGGEKLEEITKPEYGRTYSLTFAADKFFYCSDVDFKNEKVYCITEEGKFVFCYSNANLKTPTELAVDLTGNVYITDLDSHNVHRCSPSGDFLDVPLKGSDVTEPRSICFNRGSNHLALSNNSGKSICVYKSIV
ncbi:uncharacterized protein LOC127737703 [Mytilus californianus]|uniref:uncharacterized protein LOC127737703 n=1 Tax=Mytilus californianus TaxID=6549 RepID=UPI002247B8D4|nr:uncharacterized protein LOC127737703 [Mytilus californianus]